MEGNGSRPQWASRVGFVFAAAGSAVGLGNVWRFPYVAGQNGGGAFVLVYLACVLAVGLPLMMAELMAGRSSRRDAVGALRHLAGRRSPWVGVGWLGVGAAFLILSYYSVVAGWTLDFAVRAAAGAFSGGPAEDVTGELGALLADGLRQTGWHFLFLAACAAIVIAGVRKGIERWSRILMPALLLILALLVAHGLLSPGARRGVAFLFRPDFSQLTPAAVLQALGHSFFSLSLGMATLVAYGSYLAPREDLFKVSLGVASLDTAVAVMAGLAVFPVVFAAGLEPAGGPGLVFQTLPVAFSGLPGSRLLATSFFALLAFAGLTSAISLLEAQVVFLIDERGWSRRRAAAAVAALCFGAGVPSALSYNLLSGWTVVAGRPFLDSVDLVASDFLLPTGGLLLAVYAGWFWSKAAQERELLAGGARWIYPVWHALIRYVTPLAVAAVLFSRVAEAGLFRWLLSLF